MRQPASLMPVRLLYYGRPVFIFPKALEFLLLPFVAQNSLASFRAFNSLSAIVSRI